MSTQELHQTKTTRERIDYLLECYRTSCEELVFRIKQRDEWLKYQLLAQVSFLALASGIEFGGVKATSPIPSVLALAVSASLILAALYVVEDRIISYEVQYIAKLSIKEAELSSSGIIIDNVEASPEIRAYAETTLPIRFLAQVIAFLVVPGDLAVYRFSSYSGSLGTLNIIEIAVNILFWLTTAGLLILSYYQRRRTAKLSFLSNRTAEKPNTHEP